MDQRVEQILITLAQQYAPALLQTWNRQGDYSQRLPRLARGLANYGILVVMGDQPYSLRGLGDDIRTQIQAWVNGYAQFYYLLTQTLLPSFTQVSAHYTDDKWPLVIFMRGSAPAVIQRMAGYVAPFIYYRQMDATVSELELVGVMDLILEELEASSLSPDVLRKLRTDGAIQLKRMLEAQIRQLQLTEFDQPLFTASRRFVPIPKSPPMLPEEDSQITRTERPLYTRPDTTRSTQTQTLPTVPTISPPVWTPPSPAPPTPAQPRAEAPPVQSAAEPAEPTIEPTTPEANQFGSSIPIFFNRKDSSRKIRRPPLPPLPGDKDS